MIRRIVVAVVLVLGVLTGCKSESNMDKALSQQDILVMTSKAYMNNVKNLVAFLYSSPSVQEFDSFIKDYKISKELQQALEGTLSKVDDQYRVRGKVDILVNGYKIEENNDISLYYEIYIDEGFQGTSAMVFIKSKCGDNILSNANKEIISLKGYSVQ